MQAKLLQIPGLRLLNPINNLDRQPIFIFVIDQLHYNFVVALLSDLFGIQTRGGVSCCSLLAQEILQIDQHQQKQIYDRLVKTSSTLRVSALPDNYGWCRLSLHYAMTDEIIDYIVQAVNFVARNGHRFKALYHYDAERNNWFYHQDKGPWHDFSQIKLKLNVNAELNREPSTTYLNSRLLHKQIDQVNQLLKTRPP